MVANTAAGDLRTVQSQIVLICQNAAEIFTAVRQILAVRHTERIMAEIPAFFGLAPFVKRKVHYPSKSQFIGVVFVLTQVRLIRFIFFHYFFMGKPRKRRLGNLFFRINRLH